MIFNFKNMKGSYHDTDYGNFASWYNKNYNDEMLDEAELSATDPRYILYSLYINTKYRKISLDMLTTLIAIITPTIEKVNQVFNFNTKVPFFYSSDDEEDFFYQEASDEEKETSENLKIIYELLIEKYSVLTNTSFEENKVKMQEIYVSIIENGYDSEITFQMMVNSLLQQIIGTFIYEMFNSKNEKEDVVIEEKEDDDSYEDVEDDELINPNYIDLLELFEQKRGESSINYVPYQ